MPLMLRFDAGHTVLPQDLFWSERTLRRLQDMGLAVQGDRQEIVGRLRTLIKERRNTLNGILAEMRQERSRRWKDSLPRVWAHSPGRVFAWLREEQAAWGSVPLSSADGNQLVSLEEVDSAAKVFWVDGLWCRDNPAQAGDHWRAFAASEFFPHIPRASWSEVRWTGELVKEIVASFKRSAPGTWDIPVPVWQTLPAAWNAAVARLLQHIQDTSEWPDNALDAYVVLIPKGQGNDINSQRPITVLQLLFRIFAKGVARAWKKALMSEYLGEQAMGFRTSLGARHLAQFLSDVVASRIMEGKEVWFARFDIQKCYDTIPWWALWGIMGEAGIPRKTIRAFRSFYERLRRHFRFGHVDGSSWSSYNGLAQGCPAAPDMLNILLEPFHRWAVANGFGVRLLGGGLASSVSFADDVVLIAGSREEMVRYISAYLRWCSLLGLRVLLSKTEVWCSTGEKGKIPVGDVMVDLAPLFTVVGIVVGEEPLATKEHLKKRIDKALRATSRLAALGLPSPLVTRLWRSVVLAQACYGAEVRDIRPADVSRLSLAGRAILRRSNPFRIARWASPEVLMGLPLGDCAIVDPMHEIRSRQIRWIQELSNSNNIIGRLHRALATWFVGSWTHFWGEPTASLRSALADLGWDIRPRDIPFRSFWPALEEEPALTAQVITEPRPGIIPEDAFFTDGSIGVRGGGAASVAVNPNASIGCGSLCHIPSPRSTTHCELVGIRLAVSSGAKAVFSDSLAALLTIRDWETWPVSRRLKCADRTEVRAILHNASGQLHLLEKVKAHRTDGEASSDPRVAWNDRADCEAKWAASDCTDTPVWVEQTRFADQVQILDERGRWIVNLPETLRNRWWEIGRLQIGRRRPETLGLLYPPDVDFEWRCSNRAFRGPLVRGDRWVYFVSPAALRWTARAGVVPSPLWRGE